MKATIVFFFALFFVTALSAQVIVYKTQNLNFGFGINCASNQYMDFVVNGPLVGTDNIPVGGYIDNGIQIKDWVTPESGGGNFAIGNGIFGLGSDGTMHMVSYEKINQLPAMIWAIQNGPILVQEGKNVRGTSPSKYARSGIGYKNDGTVVVIISLTPVTFKEFAELFVQENCTSAIYLDGGPYVGYSNKSGSFGTLQPDATKIQFFNN